MKNGFTRGAQMKANGAMLNLLKSLAAFHASELLREKADQLLQVSKSLAENQGDATRREGQKRS